MQNMFYCYPAHTQHHVRFSVRTHTRTHTHTHTHMRECAHQFVGGERASLLAYDEAVPDPEGGEQFPPPLHIAIRLHVAGAQQQPITAFVEAARVDVRPCRGKGGGVTDRSGGQVKEVQVIQGVCVWGCFFFYRD